MRHREAQDTRSLVARRVAGRASWPWRPAVGQVDEAVGRVIHVVRQSGSPDDVRVGAWSIKDALGHLAFWHESFARNVNALVDGRTPVVLAGPYEVLNRRSVDQSRTMTVGQIAGRIRRAQGVLRRRIGLLPADTPIPYRKGSRTYTPPEHLVLVRVHIAAHTKRIERALRRHRAAPQTASPSTRR